MRSCKEASSDRPENPFGIPKIPNRKNSSVANTSPNFQPKFLVMLNTSPRNQIWNFNRYSKSKTGLRCFGLLVRSGNRDYRRPADFNPQIVRWHPQVKIIIFQGNDSSADASVCHNFVTRL